MQRYCALKRQRSRNAFYIYPFSCFQSFPRHTCVCAWACVYYHLYVYISNSLSLPLLCEAVCLCMCPLLLFQFKLEWLLIVWYVFSSFSSVSTIDYNQVFFLILQWVKEQHTVQRASRWGALYLMANNTWGSGLLVSHHHPSHRSCSSITPPLTTASIQPTRHVPSISGSLSCLLPALPVFFAPTWGINKSFNIDLCKILFSHSPHLLFLSTKYAKLQRGLYHLIRSCWFSGILDFISFLGPMSGMGMNMGMDGQWHYM